MDEELFDSAQRRLAENKRNGSRCRASVTAEHAPRYWLTGKLFCGECGGSMQGVSGTSKTGVKPLLLLLQGAEGREVLEEARSQGVGRERVTDILKGFLDDSENLVLIAVDAAKYYEGTDYLARLEQQRRDVEKGLANFVRAIEAGIFNGGDAETHDRASGAQGSLG